MNLTAERDGPHVKLTMTYPEGYDHAFMVERFDGMKTDDEGNLVEVWTPLHTGTAKFIQGDTDYELAFAENSDVPATPLPSPRKYRALAYRKVEHSSPVTLLHTDGTYTPDVTI